MPLDEICDHLTDAELESVIAGKGPMVLPGLMIAYGITKTAVFSAKVKAKERNKA